MPKGVFKRTAEHRKNISKALKGKPKTAKHRKAMKATMNKPEMIQKMREVHLGKNPKYPEGGIWYFRQLSREIWELVHQMKIPEGMDLHHIDGNVMNIDPENLQLRSRSGHKRWHKIKRMIDRAEDLILSGRKR